MTNRQDNSFEKTCREKNYFLSLKNFDNGKFYCTSKNPNCKYIMQEDRGDKLCGYYYPELWKKQRTFEDRLKDLRLGHLEEYVNLLKPKKIVDFFNFKNRKKYKIALEILKRRNSNV